MKKILLLAALAVSTTAAWAQSTETRKVSGFTRVEVQHGIEIVFVQSSTQSVKVEAAQEKYLQSVGTEMKGKTLKIYLKDNEAKQGSYPKVKVYIAQNNFNGINTEPGRLADTNDKRLANNTAVCVR